MVIFELETYPDPKTLSAAEIRRLLDKLGSVEAVAQFLDWSRSGVTERLGRKDPNSR